MATAAQLRALRKKHHLGEFSHKRKSPRRLLTHKTSMARKKGFRRIGGSRGSRSMLDNGAKGIGYAVLVKKFASGFLGQYSDIAALGAAYYGGGIEGAIGAFLVGAGSLNGSSSGGSGW